MTTTQPLDLDEIAARAAALYEYATVTDQEGQDALNELTDTDVPALLAALRDSRTEVEKLIRWHREDETAMKRMRATIERLRADLAKEQRLHGDTIDDRDRATDMADKLAYAIAPETVIGEHTADNSPWANALDLITSAAEVDKLRARVAELERPAVEAKRNEIRQSYTDLIAQAEQDRDHEGKFDVQCRLREREEQWKAEDAARPAAVAAAGDTDEANA